MKTQLFAVSALAGISVMTSASLGDRTFNDGVFASSSWGMDLVQAGGGGTATRNQILSGGNPNELYRIRTTVNAGTPAIPSNIFALLRFGTTLASRYEPGVDGAVSSVDFSIDYNTFSAFGQGQGLYAGVKQGTNIYLAAGTITSTPSVWTHRSVVGLTQASFLNVDGSLSTPDFSSLGAPIRFGFVVSNSASGAGYSITMDYDNFNVVAHTVPAPSAMAAFGIGGACLMRRRRRG